MTINRAYDMLANEARPVWEQDGLVRQTLCGLSAKLDLLEIVLKDAGVLRD